ncbi:MAG: NACHT domain-containing protein, partial [Olsenella sp.]
MKPFPDSEDDEDTPTTGRPGTCRQELDEIERLLQPDHPTARQDALQAACFVGREWLADEVDAWLRDENAPWAMLVTGSPGCGKSAFAAHELMHDDRVGAAVFCQHDGAAFDNLESVSRSVAFQLSARFPDYRSALLGVLRREEEHRGRGDEPRDGGPFERYVTSVSRNLIAGGRDEIVIIIDGLDEVAGERSGPGAVNPLAEELGRLLDEGRVPRHVRLLVTSRADAAAVGPLTAARRLDVDKFAREGEADVRTYVEARVGREDPHREEIVRRAGANFLYARVACDLADGGAFDAGAVLKGLGVLYHQYLDRAFGRPRGKLEGPAGTPGVTRDALCLVAS